VPEAVKIWVLMIVMLGSAETDLNVRSPAKKVVPSAVPEPSADVWILLVAVPVRFVAFVAVVAVAALPVVFWFSVGTSPA
jgi:hypothetical protein